MNVVVYFDQLSGAACSLKLVEILFFAVFNVFCTFQTFFSDLMPEITKKRVKMNVSFEKSILTSFWVRAAPESW